MPSNLPPSKNKRLTDDSVQNTGASSQGMTSNEEQMLRRQSAPQPDAAEFLAKAQEQKMMQGQGIGANGAVDGFKAIAQPIGKEQVQEAMQTLYKYKEGKANLERKIVENEQWYKLRHWECMRKQESDIQPISAWLLNCILNKHADAMDNFPSPNILPREEGDKAEAEMLTSIVPVILDQCDFEQVYSDAWMYKVKTGTAVYGIFWDKSKLNGLGDINICKVDIINLFWESGITDIQKSRNLFHVELADNDLLLGKYPQLKGNLSGSPTVDVAKYIYDDKVDTTNKSAVIDWYYRKVNSQGKPVLHYCKFVNNTVLFATENDPAFAERGWYDHGQYPFIFDVLYPIEGTPAGFGYIDIGKDCQSYIDRANQTILENMKVNASPRYFARQDGAVNEEEFADLSKKIVHVNGNLGQDTIMPISSTGLASIYVEVLNNKINELKETTGNRDVSTGGTTGGVTAASAIAAMQESGSKLSRDNSKAAYRAFRRICVMIIELIRQFYDMPRCFRIMGENGTMRYVQYSNAGIVPQAQGGMEFGTDMGVRLPQFDIEVTAQKASPYSKMSQNELALQFYNAGFFNPQMSDQALACLEMMDFDRKQFIMQKISQNGTMYQMMMAMQQQMLALGQMVDASRGGNEITAGLMAQFGMQPSPEMMGGGASTEAIKGNAVAGGDEDNLGEPDITKKARERAANSTDPT